ncbi:MAG: Ig-like domain-containing protein [Patescibacteria group bacterium]
MSAKKPSNRKKPTKLKLASNSRYSLKRMLPFLLVFAVVGTVMLWRTFATEGYQVQQMTLNASVLNHEQLITNGTRTLLIEQHLNPDQIKALVTDRSTGKTSYFNLPTNTRVGWQEIQGIWTNTNELWLFAGGSGPLYLRQFTLSGIDSNGLPTSAALVSERTFGDSESRTGSIIQLESGAMVVAWHQQNEPSGSGGSTQYLAYHSTLGAWTELPALKFMPSGSSDQVMAQHPADGSIWLFCNPDAWNIGAARLVERDNSLVLDWSDSAYINDSRHGIYGSDPENPDMAISPDPLTGEIVLAYESAERKDFYVAGSNYLVGSYPAIARIKAEKTISFMHMPVYVERVSTLGLTVRPGEIWLTYHPINETDLTFNKVYANVYRNGSWGTPRLLSSSATNGAYDPYYPQYVVGNTLYSFQTDTPETVLPTINVISPANGTTISSSVLNTTLSANASDATGVRKVDFFVDGVLVGTDIDAPYSFSWMSGHSTVANGPHTITATATDWLGNVGLSQVVNVTKGTTTPPPPPPSGDTTAPVVTISTPANNYTVPKGAKTLAIGAGATDNTSVTKMEVYIDGALKSITTTASISYTWNVSRLSRGQHTVLVKAYDAAGNTGSSQVVVRK